MKKPVLYFSEAGTDDLARMFFASLKASKFAEVVCVGNAEEIASKALNSPLCQQYAGQQGVSHPNDFNDRKGVGLFHVHIDDSGVDAFLPDDIDKQVARLKLAALGIEIDELTEDQKEYLSGWRQGT